MKKFFGNKYVKGITQYIPTEHFGPRDYIDWYCEQMGLSREEYMAGYRKAMDMRFNEGEKKPGPDPYMTGLDDKTKEEKEEQMKKQAGMDDDDPDAYKPMPGSAEARKKGKVKTSKFTKKYHELYGDDEANESAKSKVKPSKVRKILSNTRDWGEDAELQVYTKGNNLVYIDAWFYLGNRAHDNMIKNWSPGGDMYSYFVEEEGLKPTIVDSFIEYKARGRHKKLSDEGIVGVELSFTKVGLNENKLNEEKAEGDRSPIDDEKIEKALKKKADETDVPIGILRIIMRRGMAAWKTGHRPGATQQQWGYARVSSFLTKGDGTWGDADKDVAKEVRDGGHDKKLKKG